MPARPNSLNLIAPPPEQMAAERFSYPRLAQAVVTHYQDEYEQLDELVLADYQSEKPTVKWAERHLALIALKLQQAESYNDQVWWSQAFTDVSVRLYGRPDEAMVAKIASDDLEVFEQTCTQQPRLSSESTQAVLALYGKIAEQTSDAAKIEYSGDDVLLGAIDEYIVERYGAAFSKLDEYDDATIIDAAIIRSECEHLLQALVRIDEGWSEWRAVMSESAQLSVMPVKAEVRVGKNLPPLPVRRVKSLFRHEVLWHAQRAVNGKKYSRRLATGLAGHRKNEEGGGGLFEASLEKAMPYRFGDRYVDIGLALGLHDQPPMSRPELFELVYGRTQLRRAQDGSPEDDDMVRNIAWQHVNRIYRGTLGNEVVGVFTRDIFYPEGYREMAYQFKQYPPIYLPYVIDFALSGKINFSEATQRRYLSDHKAGVAGIILPGGQ